LPFAKAASEAPPVSRQHPLSGDFPALTLLMAFITASCSSVS